MTPGTKEPNQNILRSEGGMSLIEILIVITLMAVVGTIAATNVVERMNEGYRDTAKTQISALKGMLEDYRRYCNQYPTTEQGLEALVAKPTTPPECPNYPSSAFLKEGKVPKDPWDRPYDYQSPDGGKSFVITCYGRDGKEGGDGADKDVHSND
jgi:general secretion pathway protein G